MVQLRQITIRIHILKNAIIPNIEGLLCDEHSVYALYLLPDLIFTITLWHWCHYHHHIIITIISFLQEAQWIMGAWWFRLSSGSVYIYLSLSVWPALRSRCHIRQPLSGHTTSCTLWMPHSNPTSAESVESQDCKLIAPVLPKRCACEPQLTQCWPL